MSYDLRIAVKVAGTPKDEDLFVVIAEPECNNPTYNLGQMFRACTGWDYEQGKFYRVSDVYTNIERGIYELTYNKEKYVRYNPSNGWGSTTSALEALKSLKECIDDVENPDSWTMWNTVPKALMWVAW